MTSVTRQYNVRQVDSGPGGQTLDYNVNRDVQTGLPRVEMMFSVDPLQQRPAVTPPVITVCYYRLSLI